MLALALTQWGRVVDNCRCAHGPPTAEAPLQGADVDVGRAAQQDTQQCREWQRPARAARARYHAGHTQGPPPRTSLGAAAVLTLGSQVQSRVCATLRVGLPTHLH